MEVIPTEYIPFTPEQREQAAATNLEEFLHSRGEKLLPAGRDKRLSSDHSITVRGNEWYDHAAEKGGGPISFVQNFYGLCYPEAISLLLGSAGIRLSPATRQKEADKPKTLILPERHKDMRRVFAYLTKTRGIDSAVVSAFAHEGLIYEDAKYYNAVFVGTDENGTPRHAHIRSTNSCGEIFRCNVEGSDPHYSFHHTGTDGRLYVFEAPIDLLSYITLNPENWEQHSYLACCGLSMKPLLFRLEQQPALDQVFLCLDNDPAGDAACLRMEAHLKGQGLSVQRLRPSGKDWNDELLRSR